MQESREAMRWHTKAPGTHTEGILLSKQSLPESSPAGDAPFGFVLGFFFINLDEDFLS